MRVPKRDVPSGTPADQRAIIPDHLCDETRSAIVPTFDYGTLDPGLALKLKTSADTIRTLLRRTINDIIEAGRQLIAAKENLPHGQFGGWLASELSMGERSAQRFMALAKFAESNSDIVSDLEPSAAYALSAPSTPACVIAEVTARIGRGEAAPVQRVRLLIKAARSEQRGAKRKERSAQKRQAQARRRNVADAQAEPWEDDRRREKTAAAEFAGILSKRIDDIRGDLAELLAATNGMALLEALKAMLENRPSLATPSVPDAVVPPATASQAKDMPEIPSFLRRTLQSQADRPT